MRGTGIDRMHVAERLWVRACASLMNRIEVGAEAKYGALLV
jgi:hypothetical protein